MPWVSVGLLPALVLLGTAACEDVKGGAVEVAWVLRSQAGYALNRCDCSDPAIERLRLTLTPTSENGALMPRVYEYPCHRDRNATPFEVAPGSYEMRLVALDAHGEIPPGVVTPPPQTVKVVWGQPSSLHAQLVVVPCAAQCANKNGSCSAK